MNRTYDLNEIYAKMDCFALIDIDITERCRLSQLVKNCQFIMNFFNYFQIMYCNLNIRSRYHELLVICIYVLIVLLYMSFLMVTMANYFMPILKIISAKMQLNEYLAGVTLLAFGNSLPETMANFMPIRDHAPIYTVTIANAIATFLVSGGLVCYLRPFKIDANSAVRDLLFLLLASEMLLLLITDDNKLSSPDAITLIGVYVTYLVINICDLIIVRHTIRTLKKEIKILRKSSGSDERHYIIREKRKMLNELQKDDKMIIHYYSTLHNSSSTRLYHGTKHLLGTRAISNRFPDLHSIELDANSTRKVLHNDQNPKNLYLFNEFMETLMPFDSMDWYYTGFWGRTILILRTPIDLLCCLFIPRVDYRCDKHGWSKLLNCIQLVTSPFIVIALAEAMLSKRYNSWHISCTSTYPLWSLVITIPLAILVFCHSRTDVPPPYHFLFVLISFVTCLLILAICAAEIEVLCVIIGLLLHFTEDFVACCIRSFAAAVGDIIINSEMALQGYEKMAFAAVLAGPFFSITIGMGLSCMYNRKTMDPRSNVWLLGTFGENVHVFFTAALTLTLFWYLILNFYARRSIGILYITLYLLYLLFAILGETNVVHELQTDRVLDPV